MTLEHLGIPHDLQADLASPNAIADLAELNGRVARALYARSELTSGGSQQGQALYKRAAHDIASGDGIFNAKAAGAPALKPAAKSRSRAGESPGPQKQVMADTQNTMGATPPSQRPADVYPLGLQPPRQQHTSPAALAACNPMPGACLPLVSNSATTSPVSSAAVIAGSGAVSDRPKAGLQGPQQMHASCRVHSHKVTAHLLAPPARASTLEACRYGSARHAASPETDKKRDRNNTAAAATEADGAHVSSSAEARTPFQLVAHRDERQPEHRQQYEAQHATSSRTTSPDSSGDRDRSHNMQPGPQAAACTLARAAAAPQHVFDVTSSPSAGAAEQALQLQRELEEAENHRPEDNTQGSQPRSGAPSQGDAEPVAALVDNATFEMADGQGAAAATGVAEDTGGQGLAHVKTKRTRSHGARGGWQKRKTPKNFLVRCDLHLHDVMSDCVLR